MDISLIILAYTASIVLLVIGTLVSITLFKLIRILNTVEHIIAYIEHIRNLFAMWENLPLTLGKKALEFILEWFKK